MNRALYVAANGMAAQQQNLETIAANLSSADIAGFKGAEATAFGQRTIFTQGKLEHGTGPFDLAIDGPGFFCVLNDRGERAYTRDGEFSRAPDGTLRNAQGWKLQGVRIPENALSAAVAEDGTVTATFTNGKRRCGHIFLSEFPAPDFLRSAGGTLFFATRESGKAREVTAGSTSGPSIRFGMLERSNVTIVEAMMEILAAQRAYEANAKGVQAADEMLRIVNNLNRS